MRGTAFTAEGLVTALLETAPPAPPDEIRSDALDAGDGDEGPAVDIGAIGAEDMAEVQRGIELAFGHFGDWVWPYTQEATDWDLSFCVRVDGRMVGFYLLGRKNMFEVIADDEFEPMEVLS